MLAGLPKAPSRYSPFVSMERATQRQAYVLTRMVEDGYITESEKEAASKARISGSIPPARGGRSPLILRRTCAAIFSPITAAMSCTRRDLRFTRLSMPTCRRAANAAVERGLREFESRSGYRATFKRIPKNKMDASLKELDANLEGERI